MAKPIKHTPILRGKEAVTFHQTIESNRNKKVDSIAVASIMKNAQKLKDLLKIN